MANAQHGQVIDGILHKRGTQVVKFWAKNGYAIPVDELLKVKGVKLYSKYDGNLYADKETFNKFGIHHKFKEERQLILPLEHWEVF